MTEDPNAGPTFSQCVRGQISLVLLAARERSSSFRNCFKKQCPEGAMLTWLALCYAFLPLYMNGETVGLERETCFV